MIKFHSVIHPFAFFIGRKIPIEETAIHPRDVTSCEVADAYYTSCGDLGIKSNMSSPEPTTSQRFFNDDIDTVSSCLLYFNIFHSFIQCVQLSRIGCCESIMHNISSFKLQIINCKNSTTLITFRQIN